MLMNGEDDLYATLSYILKSLNRRHRVDDQINPIGMGCGPVAPSPVSWTVNKPIMLA